MISKRTFSGLAATTVFALGLAASAGAASRHAARPAHRNQADSFLPAAPSSVADVVRQVQSNPTVRLRYARYFRIPGNRVADYLRQNLVPTRLSQTGRYTMFLVRPNGVIYPVMTTVARGSRVFALASGPPVFIAAGGNPMTRFKTAVEMVLVPDAPAPGGATVKVSPSIENQTMVPVKVQETVMPTIVVTPIYRPASPLRSPEQSPGSATGSAEKTASKP